MLMGVIHVQGIVIRNRKFLKFDFSNEQDKKIINSHRVIRLRIVLIGDVHIFNTFPIEVEITHMR